MEHFKILLKPLIKFYSINNNLNKLLLILFFKKYKYSKNLKFQNIFKNSIQETKISLRLIDWFVTNYCKKHTILINKDNNNKNEIINIYQSYKSNLKAFSKQYFDPFRRNKKIYLVFNINNNLDIINDLNISNDLYNNKIEIIDKSNINNNYNIIETTIGQLNFFKWIIENNIYEYICIHKKIIENDMILIQKENIKKKNDKNNLIYKNIKNSDGSIKIVTRKKRVELSKSKLNNISLIQEKRIVYF
jgi:hypothetical protein